MNEAPGSDRAGVSFMEVGTHESGQRIDNFLARHLKGVPRSLIYRILRTGQVRVNSGRVRPDYRLKAGDRVRVPPVKRPSGRPVPRPDPALAERMRRAVIYEDDALLVLDKPAGVAVHGGTGVPFGLIDLLRAVRPGAEYLELVHRLDRETSGCLMVAKNGDLLRRLHRMLKHGQVEKGYLALLAGRWRRGDREVDIPLRKGVTLSGERRVAADETGKAALTRFRPVETYRDATLVEVSLATGRTHQIRVHAAAISHPVAGDAKYGDRAFNRRMRALGLRRLFLHAHSLSLRLPGSGREVHVSAPLAPDLREVLDRLEADR